MNKFQEMHFLEITDLLVLQTHAIHLMQSRDNTHTAAEFVNFPCEYFFLSIFFVTHSELLIR